MSWSTTEIFDRLRSLKMPSIGKDAPISVYLIHNSIDAEDYFFLFDFEEFAERSNAGLFVRPTLHVFAGRDDFSRLGFARQFREVFATEFDRMRVDMRTKGKSGGWLDWSFGTAIDLFAGLVATLVLAVALRIGKSIFGSFSMPSLLRGKSAEAKLNDQIEQTKSKVEAALGAIQVTVHPELLAHAERGGARMKRGAMDHDAWPLPEYVRAHLNDGVSGSWW